MNKAINLSIAILAVIQPIIMFIFGKDGYITARTVGILTLN